MKLLVFEYISGGGLVDQVLPESLLQEGILMLQTLLAELQELSDVDVVVFLDQRCREVSVPQNFCIHWISKTTNVWRELSKQIDQCDAFWPIAPETSNVLYQLARLAEANAKHLLLSDAETVRLCSSKLATARHLNNHDILTIETLPLSDFGKIKATIQASHWLIKPDDGVGAEHITLLDSSTLPASATEMLHMGGNYIVQPYIDGEPLSLSCLFKQGKVWLLSINRQIIQHHPTSLQFTGCQVNIAGVPASIFEHLLNAIAQAFPGLWGYVGIDVLLPQDNMPTVVELNPRLTTSYAGIMSATGINVAKQVVRLLTSEANVRPTKQTTHEFLLNNKDNTL